MASPAAAQRAEDATLPTFRRSLAEVFEGEARAELASVDWSGSELMAGGGLCGRSPEAECRCRRDLAHPASGAPFEMPPNTWSTGRPMQFVSCPAVIALVAADVALRAALPILLRAAGFEDEASEFSGLAPTASEGALAERGRRAQALYRQLQRAARPTAREAYRRHRWATAGAGLAYGATVLRSGRGFRTREALAQVVALVELAARVDSDVAVAAARVIMVRTAEVARAATAESTGS